MWIFNCRARLSITSVRETLLRDNAPIWTCGAGVCGAGVWGVAWGAVCGVGCCGGGAAGGCASIGVATTPAIILLKTNVICLGKSLNQADRTIYLTFSQ